MGGEAGIGGTGEIEGGVPRTVVDKSDPITPEKPRKNKTVKSKEQKEAERKKKIFYKKVALKARQLWEEDGCPEDKGLYFDYIKRAEEIITTEEIITKRDKVNARKRKAREDKKKREEPAPRPDIPNAPPDQSGEGTSGTEEIARSEAITQEPAVEHPQGAKRQKTQNILNDPTTPGRLTGKQRDLAIRRFLDRIQPDITDTLNHGVKIDPKLRGLILESEEKLRDTIRKTAGTMPDVFSDSDGSATANTEEIARSETITQEPAVEQTPPGQQEELASEDLYLKGIRDELSKLDEKGKDKKDAIGIQPTPGLQDKENPTMPEQVIPTTEETKRPVDDEGLFKKVIESTAKRLGINPNNLPPALVEKMRKDFLARKAKGRGGEALGGGGDSH